MRFAPPARNTHSNPTPHKAGGDPDAMRLRKDGAPDSLPFSLNVFASSSPRHLAGAAGFEKLGEFDLVTLNPSCFGFAA